MLDFTFTANKFDVLSGSTLEVNGTLDMNGSELVLDADADTSITADTDDTIHFKIGGNDRITFTTGVIDLKNDGSQSQLRLYCESSNAHYVVAQALFHADFLLVCNHIAKCGINSCCIFGRNINK